MKIRSGIILFIVTIATVFSFSSCAKGTYAHKSKKSNRYNAAQISPVSRKTTPVTKNYVIKNKRKRSLGQSGTFRKGKKSDLIL
jgi:flagellar basal body-associated protein FliL